MCDVKKYYNIYDELKKLKPEDTLQLVMEAENDEEKQFFEMLGNYLLQEKQNKVIEGIYFSEKICNYCRGKWSRKINSLFGG